MNRVLYIDGLTENIDGDCYCITYENGDSNRILYSQVINIELPNAEQLPYLKSLHGVPLGLVTVLQKTVFSFDGMDASLNELNPEYREYLYVRRALLFASAWSVKSFQRSTIASSLKWLMPFVVSKDGVLLRDLIGKIAQNSSFPESVSEKASLTNTRYDGEVNWLGKYLRDSGLLDAEFRQWYISSSKFEKQITWSKDDSPVKSIVLAYLLVIGYRRSKRFVSRDYKAWIESVMYKMDEDSMCKLFFLSLLFEGAATPHADNYYFAASAKSLMVLIERIAIRDSNELISDSIENVVAQYSKDLTKEELEANCVDYFRLKIPEIGKLDYLRYTPGVEVGHNNLLLMERDDVRSFVKERLVQWRVPKTIHFEDILWAKSKKEFDKHVKNGLGVAFRDKKGNLFMNKINEDLIKAYYSQSVENHSVDIVNGSYFDNSNYLLVIHIDHLITSREIEHLSSLLQKVGDPSKVLVLYCDSEMSAEIGELNHIFNSIVNKVDVKVIRYLPQNDIWELVYLGQQQLHHYRSTQILFTDWRRESLLPDEILVRILPDVILYEPYLSYNFMNLNILN
ncbi:MAG: hypothetical protein ACRCZM_00420 [Bacteroidales bacterium]